MKTDLWILEMFEITYCTCKLYLKIVQLNTFRTTCILNIRYFIYIISRFEM